MTNMTKSFTLLPVALLTGHVFAQDIVYDDFSMSPGYEHMVFYSVDSGVVGQAVMASWDLAFDVRPMGGTARINGGQGMSLFPAGPLSGWNGVDESFIETAGTLEPLRNDQSSWGSGAFSQGGDGGFDLGWGVYDMVTHYVISDSMYVISLPDGSWKKFALLSLQSGVYAFQCANLDGTEYYEDQIVKDDYPGKLLAFYNLTNQEALDLEPSTGWDMLFLRYVEEIQPDVFYGVTGALTHPETGIQMMEGMVDPFSEGAIDVPNMSYASNAIGYDWKSYAGGSFTVLDDRCYFIQTVAGAHYRVVFTEFEGSMSGNVELGKVLLSGAQVGDFTEASASLDVFPNPATTNQHLTIQSSAPMTELNVYGLAGGKIYGDQVQGWNTTLNLDKLHPGVYLIEVFTTAGREVGKVTVQ